MSVIGDDGQKRPHVTFNASGVASVEVTDVIGPPCVMAGTANPALADDIARHLGVPMLERRIEKFPDGEMYVRLGTSVRGRDAYIIQPTCSPVNDNLFELLLLIDTIRRASAARLTAIVPYYGYARQDRKFIGREPISAKLVANLIAAAGASRLVAIDLHSPAIQGFFDIGMDHLTAIPLLTEYLAARTPPQSVIVSPDTGGVKRADLYAHLLNLPIAILHKRRSSPRDVEIAAVVGDIRDKYPIIVDDIIATGGTIREAVDTLVQAGARPSVTVAATHAAFAGDATQLLNHPAIKEIVVTDTIPLSPTVHAALPMLRVVSISALLADAIARLHNGLSLSELFARAGTPPV